MSVRGITVRATLLALAALILVPVGQVEVTAVPVTQSEELEGLPSAETAEDGLATASTAGDASRSQPVEAPLTFSSVGITTPADAGEVRVRTSLDGEEWSDWEPVDAIEEVDGPDEGTAEARAAEGGRHTEPVWVGEASYLQVEVAGADTEDLDVAVIDSMGHSGGPVERRWDTQLGAAADAASLDVVERPDWGADESLGSKEVTVADEVHLGVVHHTAHASGDKANSYSRDEAPGIMRAMYQYHTESLGWKDIGYNVVVDRFGRVYEGRRGGLEQGVVGAHAAGYNYGSFGVSVMGNFLDEQASSESLDALTDVIAAKSEIHDIDPTGWTDEMGSNWRPTIVGHRDVGQTSCPGEIAEELDDIRSGAADRIDTVSLDYSNRLEDELDYGEEDEEEVEQDLEDGLEDDLDAEPEPPEEPIEFDDVADDSPHRESIMRLAADGVTTGCAEDRFCPDETLSRAQASAFVVRALELTPIPGSQFDDVPEDHAHADAINVLVDRGWLQGYPDGTFRPWDEMTRGQLATLLAAAGDVPDAQPLIDYYPDVARDHVHAEGVYALHASDIVGDCGSGDFCPDDDVKRDSTANFVDQVRELRGFSLTSQ
ncbi:MAG: S-layer homology domain-containing protein [Actinomycetota bacterium]